MTNEYRWYGLGEATGYLTRVRETEGNQAVARLIVRAINDEDGEIEFADHTFTYPVHLMWFAMDETKQMYLHESLLHAIRLIEEAKDELEREKNDAESKMGKPDGSVAVS